MVALLSKSDQQRIQTALTEMEKNTDAEIHIHINRKSCKDVMVDAIRYFTTVKLHETKHHCNVLIYIALKKHQFAVLGDKGIYQKLPAQFWQDLHHQMRDCFVKDQLVEGLVIGIQQLGKVLQQYCSSDT